MGIIRMTKSRLGRCLAILFLLYTVVDIACPQLCSEEPISLVAVNETSRLNTNTPASATRENVRVVSTREDSQRNEPTNQGSQHEDCFCCARVVPGMVYVAPALLDLKSPALVPIPTSALTPPLFPTFHPPRFA
jgi:hypothetical protein